MLVLLSAILDPYLLDIGSIPNVAASRITRNKRLFHLFIYLFGNLSVYVVFGLPILIPFIVVVVFSLVCSFIIHLRKGLCVRGSVSNAVSSTVNPNRPVIEDEDENHQ